MKKLVIVRHGESIWNKENKFTGWTDVELSENGIKEAQKAGIILKENNYTFDIAYTSVLKRAIDTLNIILKELNLDILINYSYKLNERHYGALQGLNKDDIKNKYGEAQLKLWRRSVDVRPPKLTIDDERYPGNDVKYKGIDNLPLTENLQDTIDRVSSYYEEEIKKNIIDGKNVIISAHGNSLRALIKYIFNLSNDEVINLEIKTGLPIVIEFEDDLTPIRWYYISE